MQWENLSATDFKQAVQDTGVCVLPLGVIEKHSEHLPLGTDCFISHRISCLAAAQEPAVVYPSFYFGQIYEASCFPGTVTIRPQLLFDLLVEVLDNIGRNGFRKIVLYNGHGGNNHLIGFLAQCSLWQRKSYELYIPTRRLTVEGQQEWDAMAEAPYGGHAGEYETALMLGLYPDLVQMDRLPDQPARPQGRLKNTPDTYNAIWWYGDYPDHYAGDGSKANVTKGQRLVALSVEYLAQYIAMVKADTVIPALTEEFFKRASRTSD